MLLFYLLFGGNMNTDTYKVLLMSCQHELTKAKTQFKAGIIDIESLRAVNKALESIQHQIMIERDKGAK